MDCRVDCIPGLPYSVKEVLGKCVGKQGKGGDTASQIVAPTLNLPGQA